VRRRRSAGRIAVEDHGPRRAPPVVVVHAPTNGRHLPRQLVASLQRVGLRPISIERPGYGLTTPQPADAELYAEALADMIDVLDALDLDRVRIVGRGCAISMAFGARHPERFERGVLLGPSTPDTEQWRRDGLMGAVATLLMDRPHLMDAFGAMLARGATREGLAQILRTILRNSPTDLAALSDPQTLADFVRAAQQAAIGGSGFLCEMPVFAANAAKASAQDGRRWVIVIGDRDPMQKIADPASAWEPILPGARVLSLPGAGRFPHITHADEIAAALL
jgi:pimeloyl-ACP methyl ester carboxylesterase